MSTGHVHALYIHGDSVLHRMAPQVKVAAAVLVVFGIVATPRESFWAFAGYGMVSIVLLALGRLPLSFVGGRLLFETPFLILALMLPFLAEGPRTELLGISLSIEGLWGAWNLAVKATLGMLTAVTLAGTTTIPDLLKGLDALRTPRIVTSIMGFMIRYADVIASDFSRMRVAMAARGYRPRWLGSLAAFGHTFGTVFVRTYERGEAVYLAMLSRGYRGVMPGGALVRASRGQWLAAAVVVAAVWTVAVGSLVSS